METEIPNQNLEKKDAIEKFDFSKHFIDALISFLVVAIGYLFIMPWNIWSSAAKRLAVLRSGEGIIQNLTKTEFIVLNWLRLLYDALTFIIYIIGPIYILYSAITDHYYTFGQFIITLLSVYFIPLIIGIVRELFSLSLIIAMKLEEISRNTKK